jgi:hypothetical protein
MANPSASDNRWSPWPELLLYTGLTFLFLVPQSLSPATRVAYVGDSLESVAIVGFVGHQIVRDPRQLFDAGFLHPTPNALTLTDHRLLPSILAAPVLWISKNPVLAYNAALLFAYVLAGFGGRKLALTLGLGRLASGFAGALFAFHTYAINEAPRLNIVCHGFVAYALAELVRWLDDEERGANWRFAGFLLLQGLSANYHLLYGVMLSTLVILTFLAARPKETCVRVAKLLLPGITSALFFLPILLPYLRTFSDLQLTRSRPRGIDLLHYFSTSPTNGIWGAIGPPARLQQQGPHFVGFLALVLAALGLAAALDGPRVGPRARRFALPIAGLTLGLVVLSLGDRLVVGGKDLGPGPYGVLYDHAPGFNLVRIPERLGLFVMLGVGLLAGIALDRAVGAGRMKLAVALAGLALLEHFSPLPIITEVPRPSEIPPVYRWLARQPRSAIVEIPVRGEALIRQETTEMFFATFHRQREPLGYTAYPTLLSKVVRRALLEFPSEASLTVLAKLGITRAVVHEGREFAPDLRNQVFNFGPRDREKRFADAVAEAHLDVFSGTNAVAEAGRIVRETRFDAWHVGSFGEGGEAVYRLPREASLSPAPRPNGDRVDASRLTLRTKEGDAAPAFDDRLDTAYRLERPLRGDELIEARFKAPIRVSGVEIVLRHESAWPTRFRIAVLREQGWAEVAQWDGAHLIQLVNALLEKPSGASIGFALDGAPVLGVSILPQVGATSTAGWNVPEIRILEAH